MTAINSLPSTSLWSLLNKKGQFFLMTQPKFAKKIFPNRVEDLLTGTRSPLNGLQFLESFIEDRNLENLETENKWLIHLFYEVGYLWNKGEIHDPDLPLAIILDYQEETPFDPSDLSQGQLNISWKRPDFKSYSQAFEAGRKHLRRGDCYQYNLTFPFEGSIEEGNLENIIGCLWRNIEHRGEFAHLTFLGDEFFISNTPECLFDWKIASETDEFFSYLESRPIKGTMAASDKQSDVDEKWKKLQESEKDESELYMITDLIRNDLNRIEEPRVNILKKKALIKVPGLIHSYSHLSVGLSSKVSSLEIVKSLFPGGSITGAPKIRVMDIIKKLEGGTRGFYCGSTLMPIEDSIVGTINIRSAYGSLEAGKMTYHAGGGITWDSSAEGEYQEMDNKFLSFHSLLTLSEN